MVYIYIWKYHVKPQYIEDFEREYGDDGAWVLLFKKSSSYQSTKLMKHIKEENCYITIDKWNSYDEFVAFKNKYESDFVKIDATCEEFTINELHLGEFTDV